MKPNSDVHVHVSVDVLCPLGVSMSTSVFVSMFIFIFIFMFIFNFISIFMLMDLWLFRPLYAITKIYRIGPTAKRLPTCPHKADSNVAETLKQVLCSSRDDVPSKKKKKKKTLAVTQLSKISVDPNLSSRQTEVPLKASDVGHRISVKKKLVQFGRRAFSPISEYPVSDSSDIEHQVSEWVPAYAQNILGSSEKPR
jgi:hypothetical protein